MASWKAPHIVSFFLGHCGQFKYSFGLHNKRWSCIPRHGRLTRLFRQRSSSVWTCPRPMQWREMAGWWKTHCVIGGWKAWLLWLEPEAWWASGFAMQPVPPSASLHSPSNCSQIKRFSYQPTLIRFLFCGHIENIVEAWWRSGRDSIQVIGSSPLSKHSIIPG